MAASDGTITFSTSLDNSDLEKQLKQAESRIESLKRKIEADTTKRTLIEKQMERSDKAIEKTEAEINRLRDRIEEINVVKETDANYAMAQAEMQQQVIELTAQLDVLKKQTATRDQLNEKLAQQNDLIEVSTQRLQNEQSKMAELGVQAQQAAAKSTNTWTSAGDRLRAKFLGVATSAQTAMTNAANQSFAPWEMVVNKISKTMRKLFLFSFIVAGLREIKEVMSDVFRGSAQFNSAMANLKAVFSGFVAQLAGLVLPVLVNVVNLIAGVLERLAGLIDFVFGTNIAGQIAAQRAAVSSGVQSANAEKSAKYTKDNAKAQEKQAKAAKKLAKAQKDANRQLMSFDELNVLSAESSEDATDALNDYADAVEQPEYEVDPFASFTPDVGALGGLLDWLDLLKQRIETDVTGPFARIREGLELIKQGFGEIVQGIQNGDWALVWQGIVDVVVGSLYVIEGAFDAFVDWLNEVTGGEFATIFEGMKTTVHGLVEFIEGVLRGDLELACKGITDIIDGILSMIGGSFNATVETVRRVLNNFFDLSIRKWNEFFDGLEKRFPGFKQAFEFLRLFITGGLGTIKGALDGLLTFIGTFVDSAIKSLSEIATGIVTTIEGIFTGNGSLVETGVKDIINGVITLLEGAVNSVINGAVAMLNDIIGAVNMVPGVSFGYVQTNLVQIPRLATGAVIPPNREFMAVLGDQSHGTNLEAPESLIRQIVREESNNAAMLSVLQAILQAVQNGQVIQCDGYTLAKVVNNQNRVANTIYGR